MMLDLATPSGACAIRPPDHEDMFGSWSSESQHPFLFDCLRRALIDLPATIARGKSRLAIAESPDRLIELQLVGSRVTLMPESPWGDQPLRT